MVPLVIAVVVFCVASYVAMRWAPPLRDTRVGRLAALIVAVLFGAALVVIAIDVYDMIRELDKVPGSLVDFSDGDAFAGALRGVKSEIVAKAIREALASAGPLLGFAAAVHLLAPPPAEAEA